MATSEQKRQKKLKKRKQKQNLTKRLSNTVSSKNPVTLYSKYPIHECLVPEKNTFGQNGKPFYINGPNETLQQSERIVNQLRKLCSYTPY